jgi:hypothetical protein
MACWNDLFRPLKSICGKLFRCIRETGTRGYTYFCSSRASTHETTGGTPASMVFERELRLPCDFMFGAPTDKDQSATNYVVEVKLI